MRREPVPMAEPERARPPEPWTTLDTIAFVPLSQGRVAIVDKQDLPLVSNEKWWWRGDYAVRGRRENGTCRAIFMHHVILPKRDGLVIDHINHDKLDNRRCNLRYATHAENVRNSKRASRKLPGAHRSSGKWSARIGFNGKSIHLGMFETEIEAHEAYKIARRKLHGSFAPIEEIAT